MKTKAEIVLETIAYYCRNPRALVAGPDGGSCRYLTPEGHRCAFSRCCTAEGVEQIKDNEGTVYSLNAVEELLQPEYRGHEMGFWRDLQTIHDCSHNWADKSWPKGTRQLTQQGYVNVAAFCPEITLGQLLEAQLVVGV